MSKRISDIEYKRKARTESIELKHALNKYNQDRARNLRNLRSKTAIGLASVAETAASFAKEMIVAKRKNLKKET